MAKAHLKVIEVNWKALLLWDEIELEICYWKCGQRSSGQKSWGMIQLVQKLGSLLLWRCINVYGTGSLHIWKGAIKAEQWRQMLKQHVLPSFWGKALQEPTYCIYYNSIASKSGYLAPVQTLRQLKTFGVSWNEEVRSLYQTRRGKHSSPKSPEAGLEFLHDEGDEVLICHA